MQLKEERHHWLMFLPFTVKSAQLSAAVMVAASMQGASAIQVLESI